MGPKKKCRLLQPTVAANSQTDANLRLEEATAELVKSLGVSSFDCSNCSTQKPVEWIKTELTGKAEVKKKNIKENIRFYLGAGQIEQSIENAVDKVYERDYQNEGPQIFVPPQFIQSSRLMGMFENETKAELEKRMKELTDSLSDGQKKKKGNQRDAAEGELAEKEVYDALKEYFKEHQDQEVLVIHSYNFAKKVPGAEHREKDFIIVNMTSGYIMNIEVKNTPTVKNVKSASEQLGNTKDLLTDWFGGTGLLKKFKYISVFYTCKDGVTKNQLEKYTSNNFWIFGEDQVPTKLKKIHSALNESQSLPSKEDFEVLAKNLLFYTTVQQLPLKCNFDKIVMERFQGITPEDVDFWNLTPDQMSLMHSDQKCVLFTSAFSTGKTMLMVDKAKKVAEADKDAGVLFAISGGFCKFMRKDAWPIMLKARLENLFQESKNVKVVFIKAGLEHLVELIEKHPSESIFADEILIKNDDDISSDFSSSSKKLEDLARHRSKHLWIAATKIPKIDGMEEWLNTLLRNQSIFYNPQLSYCMRNSKRIFNEAEAAHLLFNQLETISSRDSAQLPQNVPEGKISSIEHATDVDWKFIINQALKAHPTEAVIIVVDQLLHTAYRLYSQNLCNDIAKAVADFRKIQPLTIGGDRVNAVEAEEFVHEAGKWLKEQQGGARQDLITVEGFMHGFEWPHIIWIGRSLISDRASKNIIMRSVSTFSRVLLQDSFLQHYEESY